MAVANPLWGAPRIHGELLKLGFDVSERTVSRLMPRRRKPPSQSWRTFLNNHLGSTVAVDFFAVPTLSCRLNSGSLLHLLKSMSIRVQRGGGDGPATRRDVRKPTSFYRSRLE